MENPEQKNNLVNYMSNPRSFTLKKWVSEIIKKDYQQHEETIERVATALLTEKDLENFGKLIMGIYESAYKKAVDDYKKQFEKMGVKISIGTQELS